MRAFSVSACLDLGADGARSRAQGGGERSKRREEREGPGRGAGGLGQKCEKSVWAAAFVWSKLTRVGRSVLSGGSI